MELRKDPITRSWVAIRDGEPQELAAEPCPYCPGSAAPAPLLSLPEMAAALQVRVYPQHDPLFRIEGETARAAEGIYDKMRAVGAHEVVVEFAAHDRRLSRAADAEIGLVLEAYARRLADLKRDDRFKYIAVYKNVGAAAGQHTEHSYSEVVATPFVPRRVLHELRSAREYFQMKERCLYCDMLRQEVKLGERVVEVTENFVVFCPFATRSPYEVWLLPRRHHHKFEADPRRTSAELARLLRHTLQRVEQVAEGYHYVLHTAPNTAGALERVGFWKSLEEDFHWHLELMPIVARKPRPYIAKEVYISTVSPESAAARLRGFAVSE